jgi:hypothetical protein
LQQKIGTATFAGNATANFAEKRIVPDEFKAD